jgi:hypothetical protein
LMVTAIRVNLCRHRAVVANVWNDWELLYH